MIPFAAKQDFIFLFYLQKLKQEQHWNVCYTIMECQPVHNTPTYFIFALVTPAECALHGVAALYPDLSPYDNTCRRLFRALHDEAAAAHAEGWSDLGQDLRKGLENEGKIQDEAFYCRWSTSRVSCLKY